MEKKIYTAPQVEVLRFASEDVITTSGVQYEYLDPYDRVDYPNDLTNLPR